MRSTWLALAVLVTGCAATSGGTSSDGGGSKADADPLLPDADPFLPDADPQAPDAAPPDPRRGWIDLGGPISEQTGNRSSASSPVVTFLDGAPVVAFTETGPIGTFVYARRYDELHDTWIAMGQPQRASTVDGSVTYDPSLAVVGGTLFSVWPEWSQGEMSTSAARWNGSGWSLLPQTPLGFGPYSFYPHSSAIDDGAGALWVAWSETVDFVAPMRIYVRSFKDEVWTDRGSMIGAMTTAAALAPELARGGGKTFMTWIEDGQRLASWNGSSWDPVLPLIAPPGGASHKVSGGQLAVDGAGRPILAFTSNQADPALGEASIYLARLEGGAWQFWTQALQATPGVHESLANHTYLADLVVDAGGTAYVAWYEIDDFGNYSTYVHRCNASGCTPVGPDEGRLSFDAGASDTSWPRLAIDALGRPIATWTETVGEEARVHVWRYHGDP
jgi:hypothetical protein